MSTALHLEGCLSFIVQVADPATGAVRQRVPAVACKGCGDIVLAGAALDARGRCSCCVRAAREQSA